MLLFNWANRKNGTNWWATPGGGLEEGEKSKAAARRELFEEAGIEADDLEGPIWRAEHFFRSGPELIHQIEPFFLVRVGTDAVSTAGFDAFEIADTLGHRWWPLDEIETTREAIFPRGLAGLVRDLIRDGVPAKAISIKG